MPIGKGVPDKILHHTIILILASVVVRVEIDVPLTKSVILKEIVNVTDHSVCSKSSPDKAQLHKLPQRLYTS